MGIASGGVRDWGGGWKGAERHERVRQRSGVLCVQCRPYAAAILHDPPPTTPGPSPSASPSPSPCLLCTPPPPHHRPSPGPQAPPLPRDPSHTGAAYWRACAAGLLAVAHACRLAHRDISPAERHGHSPNLARSPCDQARPNSRSRTATQAVAKPTPPSTSSADCTAHLQFFGAREPTDRPSCLPSGRCIASPARPSKDRRKKTICCFGGGMAGATIIGAEQGCR
ncbi:hypothetical protein DFH27DRAFT_548844 [Peziza echinospora]|nr:hypothetical protein DFH27DRAFT_548844 [Peziza echinospora]